MSLRAMGLLVVLMAGCGAPARVAAPPETVEAVAMRLMTALIACDQPAARAVFLTHDELQAMTRRAPQDRGEYDAEVTSFITARCREFTEAHVKVISAAVVKTRHLAQRDSPDRLLRDVDASWVNYVFEINGTQEQRGMPFLFLQTEHGARFSLKN